VSYHVVILPKAKIQLYEAARWWAINRSAEQAARWLDGFEEALASLENEPERFSTARENDAFPFTVRQLPYGLGRKKTHRAVFEVRGNQVIVHSIRHLAQDDLAPENL
jgi:plasmid stabilization system protein ParE